MLAGGVKSRTRRMYVKPELIVCQEGSSLQQQGFLEHFLQSTPSIFNCILVLTPRFQIGFHGLIFELDEQRCQCFGQLRGEL